MKVEEVFASIQETVDWVFEPAVPKLRDVHTMLNFAPKIRTKTAVSMRETLMSFFRLAEFCWYMKIFCDSQTTLRQRLKPLVFVKLHRSN